MVVIAVSPIGIAASAALAAAIVGVGSASPIGFPICRLCPPKINTTIVPPLPGTDCWFVEESVAQIVAALNVTDGCGNSFNSNGRGMSKNLAAMWLRALFHDGGSFRGETNDGGIDGSIVNEVSDTEALGLGASLPIIANNGEIITNPLFNLSLIGSVNATPADLLALSAITAAKHCADPTETPFLFDIQMQLGRKTAAVSSDDSQAFKIPTNISLTSDELFENFFLPMNLNRPDSQNFTKVDMFALVTGSHSLGGAHIAVTPEVTQGREFRPFDKTPSVLDNDIFVTLFNSNGTDCVLPIDCSMAKDPDLRFTLFNWANRPFTFFTDYEAAMKKFLLLNSNRTNLVPQQRCPFNVGSHNFASDTAAGNSTGLPQLNHTITTTFSAASSCTDATVSLPVNIKISAPASKGSVASRGLTVTGLVKNSNGTAVSVLGFTADPIYTSATSIAGNAFSFNFNEGQAGASIEASLQLQAPCTDPANFSVTYFGELDGYDVYIASA